MSDLGILIPEGYSPMEGTTHDQFMHVKVTPYTNGEGFILKVQDELGTTKLLRFDNVREIKAIMPRLQDILFNLGETL